METNNTTATPVKSGNETTRTTGNHVGQVARPAIISTKKLSVYFGSNTAVSNISLAIPRNMITAIIGSSGCGKSTLLKQFNRMNDFTYGFSMEGDVCFNGISVYDPDVNATNLRRQIGMVFQKPNVFPESIYRNIAWGSQLHHQLDGAELDAVVENSLVQANLWDEVQFRLSESALNLSGGQQQRLCIARALAMEPEILLMDEPCSALDPVSTIAIENLLTNLKTHLTIVLVTHDISQAQRVSDYTAFLEDAQLVDFGETQSLLSEPRKEQTKRFIESGNSGLATRQNSGCCKPTSKC